MTPQSGKTYCDGNNLSYIVADHYASPTVKKYMIYVRNEDSVDIDYLMLTKDQFEALNLHEQQVVTINTPKEYYFPLRSDSSRFDSEVALRVAHPDTTRILAIKHTVTGNQKIKEGTRAWREHHEAPVNDQVI